MRGTTNIAIALLLLISLCNDEKGVAQSQQYFPDPDTAIQHRLEEWQDLKFGLLMHWGTYSQWGIVESWSICPEDLSWATGARKKGVADNYADYVKAYENLKTTFNPVKFDPAKWASAAKEAGMKYMVFTTKHHDGFCMFDSKYTDYKVTDAGCPFSRNPKANITKAIFSAFRKENFWIGAYFSKPDWHSDTYWWKQFPVSDRNANYAISKYPEQWKKYADFTHNQLNELNASTYHLFHGILKKAPALNDGNYKTVERIGESVEQSVGVELRSKQNKKINCIVLNEDLSKGQHCIKFKLLLFDNKDALVKEIYGTTIGRKRIISFPAVTINTIELTIEEQNGTTSITEIEAYRIDENLVEK